MTCIENLPRNDCPPETVASCFVLECYNSGLDYPAVARTTANSYADAERLADGLILLLDAHGNHVYTSICTTRIDVNACGSITRAVLFVTA